MDTRKIIAILIFNMFIASTLMSNAQVSYIYASWSDQEIILDGDFDNWTDALDHSISSLQSQIYLKNTKDNFYIAIFHYSSLAIANVSIILDTNHDLTTANDMKLVTSTNTEKDYYFTGISSLLEDTNENFDARFDNSFTLAGTPGDFFEFKIPLIPPASQLLTDLFVIDPSDYLLGFDIAFGLANGSYLSISQGMGNNINGNAVNYITAVLAPPGRFRTPEFSPQTSFVPSTTTQGSSTTDGGYVPGVDYTTTTSTQAYGAGTGFSVIDSLFFLIGVFVLVITFRRGNSK